MDILYYFCIASYICILSTIREPAMKYAFLYNFYAFSNNIKKKKKLCCRRNLT